MKKYKKFIITVIVLLIVLPIFVFCAYPKTPKEFITYQKDKVFTNKYVDKLEGVVSCEYEKIDRAYVFLGKKYSMGPTDPEYRGIITLSEEEGKKIFNSYDWHLDNTFNPSGMVGSIDTSYLNGDEWYFNYDFDNEYFYMGLGYVRFNGKDTIIFDQQMH